MKLRNILIVIFLLVGVIPLLTITIFGLDQFKTNLEQETSNKVLALAEVKEGLVFTYINSLEKRTIDFSSDGFIRDSLVRINKGDTSVVASLNDHVIKNKKSLDKTIVGISIINLDGKIVASTNKEGIGKNDLNHEFVIKGKKGLFVSDSNSELDGHFGLTEGFIISAPLTNKKTGELIGIMVIFFNNEELINVLSGEFQLHKGALTALEGTPKTLESYMVNREKNMFIHSSSNQSNEIIVNTLPIQKCLENNEEMVGKYINYEGEEVIGASMCVADQKWTILVEVKTEEAFSIISKSYRLLLVAVGILGLLILLVSLVFVRFITKPINQLSSTVNEISKGNFKVDIQTEGFINEINSLQESLKRVIASMKLAILENKGEKSKKKENSKSIIQRGEKNAKFDQR